MTRSDLADIAMTWSALKMMAHCPAKVRHVALQADGGEQTLAMRMGSGVHALTFGTPPVDVFDGTRRKGSEKTPSDWDKFQIAAVAKHGPNVVILNPREYEVARAMANALHADPVAAPLLFADGCEYEQPMTWEVGGRRYRTRGIDFINRSKRYIGELKSSRTAKPSEPGRPGFERDQLRALYPAQVEMYDEGDAILTGRDREAEPFEKYIVAIEPSPPFVVCVYRLADSAIRQARRTIGLYRSQLATCEASNSFPGYSLSVVPFEVEESEWDAAEDEEMAADAGPFESATWPASSGITDEAIDF